MSRQSFHNVSGCNVIACVAAGAAMTRLFMKTQFLIGIVLCATLSTTAVAVETNYKIIERIKVPDGGFDYATFDSGTGRVLMARTDFTTVIDAKSGKVSQLDSAAPGHMAVPVPGTSLIVLPQRPGMVRIVDMLHDKMLADIPAGQNPDGAAYDSFSKLVFVMNHDSGESTVIDPVARKAVATIPIGGTLEFPASDGAGKVFVNITSVPEIAVIDVKKRIVTDHYKLDGCRGASGLAYAAQAKLLISSCGNGMAKVLDAATGKEVASLAIGRGPDAVIYDSARRLAFIPCGGDGVLEVISLADPNHISVVQHLTTQAGSRTGTLDPKTGRLYLMASAPDPTGAPGPGGRGIARVPGTYEVLVVSP
jgi:YVTN family beta-propeller protein